jgi:hypothetical protein
MLTPNPVKISKRDRAKAKAEALTARRSVLRAEWAVTGAALTRDEAVNGAVCRGCGLEVVGDGVWRGHIPLERKAEYARITATETARFRATHPECSGNTIRLATSTTRHCIDCCPPLPHVKVVLGSKLPDEHEADLARR